MRNGHSSSDKIVWHEFEWLFGRGFGLLIGIIFSRIVNVFVDGELPVAIY